MTGSCVKRETAWAMPAGSKRFLRSAILQHLTPGSRVERRGVAACQTLMEDIEGVGGVGLSRLFIVHQSRVPILLLFGLVTLPVSDAVATAAA